MWKLWLQVVLHEYVCGVYSNWFYCAYQFQFKHYTATHNEIVGMWAHGSQFNFPPQTSSMVNQQKVSSFLGHHRRDPGRVVSQEISQFCQLLYPIYKYICSSGYSTWVEIEILFRGISLLTLCVPPPNYEGCNTSPLTYENGVFTPLNFLKQDKSPPEAVLKNHSK
jgi:hypothetical protein